MLGRMFDCFIEKSPMTVMARALIINTLSAKTLEEVFERWRDKQYLSEVLFSSLVHSMMMVSCRFFKSPRAVYLNHPKAFTATLKCVYEKLQGIELPVMRGLLQDHVSRLVEIYRVLGVTYPSLLPGYTIRILDGNALAGTDHRLKVLRNQSAAALPGKTLVVLDPDLNLVIDVFPCEDGHAQERSLLGQVLRSVKAGELWIEDRNFCTLGFLIGIANKQAFFLVRQHKSMPYKELGHLAYAGEVETGDVFEQEVQIELDGEVKTMRRILLKLKEPTRDGEMEVSLLCNVARVDAKTLANLYLKRWKIENVFNVLTTALKCEHKSLGYPNAALFGFVTTLLAYNILATIKVAVGKAHPNVDVEEEISMPLLTEHISANYRGMMSGTPVDEWDVFRDLSAKDMAAFLLQMAAKVDLSPFYKAPSTKKNKKVKLKPPYDPKKPHIATSRLLASLTSG